jgi:hypothetical protein
MRRREPPQLATWMLEHLTPADRDEAVSGDLIEVFRTGRSDRWYWRQVLHACLLAWCQSLRARFSLFVFVLLWSMLAPAWKVLCDSIDGLASVQNFWLNAGPAWLLPVFVFWLLFNALFLWTGVMLFVSSHSSVRGIPRNQQALRALLLAPMVFAPAYGAAFALAGIYKYPFLAHAHYAATPLGQIADFSLLADLTRIPYVIALLAALWRTVPSSRQKYARGQKTPPDPTASRDAAAVVDPSAQLQTLHLVIAAGLVNSMIVGFLLCQLPQAKDPSLPSLWLRASIFVLLGAFTGVAGSWFYWMSPWSPLSRKPPIPFAPVGLACAACWLWVPAIVLFLEQVSAVAAIVAMFAAYALAEGLRPVMYSVSVRTAPAGLAVSPDDSDLFAEALQRPSFELHGYLIALCLCIAVYAIATQSNYTAAAMLAVAAFVFRWKNAADRDEDLTSAPAYRRAAEKVLRTAVPAVFVTMWALLAGVAYRGRVAIAKPATAHPAESATNAKPTGNTAASAKEGGLGGYTSIILSAPVRNDRVFAPVVPADALIAQGLKQTLRLRFDGAYWYLQPPDQQPGPLAHSARGTPLYLDIRSANDFPIVVVAHQALLRTIQTSQCREIDVEVANNDNHRGAVALALLLTDGTPAKKSSAYIGQQPIVSTQPDHFVYKSSPVIETLRFYVPEHAALKQFDGISLEFLPDIEHTFVAPKISIDQLQLIPH